MEDAKYLTALGLQVGLKYSDPDKSVVKFLPNATKCDTWNDVRASHLSKNHKVVFILDNIKGILILLSLGIGVATLTLFIELEVMRVMTKATLTEKRRLQNGKKSGMARRLKRSPHPPFITV